MFKNFADFLNESQKFTDDLLDKISDEGIESLTDDEKAYLDATSKNNKHLATEIENRILGIEEKKPEYKFDSDDEDEEDEEGELMEPKDPNKKLLILADRLNQIIISEIAPDMKGDDEAVEGFIKNVLLCISKIRKDLPKAKQYIEKVRDYTGTESFHKYQDAEWFEDAQIYVGDIDNILHEMFKY